MGCAAPSEPRSGLAPAGRGQSPRKQRNESENPSPLGDGFSPSDLIYAFAHLAHRTAAKPGYHRCACFCAFERRCTAVVSGPLPILGSSGSARQRWAGSGVRTHSRRGGGTGERARRPALCRRRSKRASRHGHGISADGGSVLPGRAFVAGSHRDAALAGLRALAEDTRHAVRDSVIRALLEISREVER